MAEPVNGFAVAAVREDGKWRCTPMDVDVMEELNSVVTELRKLRTTGACVGLLSVDDEFFVLVRPSPTGVALLLSDGAAAIDYDIAADVLDSLGAELPEDYDELWPEGDLGILADLGLPEGEMQVIVSEEELYPDEQLHMIAQRCGFDEQLDAVLDKIGA